LKTFLTVSIMDLAACNFKSPAQFCGKNDARSVDGTCRGECPFMDFVIEPRI